MGESVNLEFARGESESCHIVDILQDELCEHPVPENFFADLAYVSGIQDITIVRDVTQVPLMIPMNPSVVSWST